MKGLFALVLHGHLPFVRHPEHEQFLEETWLFEAVTECYIPLLQVFERWAEEGMQARVTLTLSPTLCEMLQDPLLQIRALRYIEGLVDFAERECHRTLWLESMHQVAEFYRERVARIRDYFMRCGGNLLVPFRTLQEAGILEIITCAATHAVLPLLKDHPPSIRGQILTATHSYRRCFGRDPRAIWLPECAYDPSLDPFLKEAGLRWFILETHGLMNAEPRPRVGVFAPILTPEGLAAFGRDAESARQVWSRHEGYPGDPRYRDFYRDAGFDLDWDYVKPRVSGGIGRGFTGLKYHRISGPGTEKQIYDRAAAMDAVGEHVGHFLDGRVEQFRRLHEILDRPAILVAPYDAELFGHWWYEGPEFLDQFVRRASQQQQEFEFASPQDYLEKQPLNQIATPSPSSWGEGGYWSMWLNQGTAWIYPRLRLAQERMSGIAARFNNPSPVELRVLRQAGRELLLAQASDWPFIITTGSSPEYARGRIETHLGRFTTLYQGLTGPGVDVHLLEEFESKDNLFPDLDYRSWVPREP